MTDARPTTARCPICATPYQIEYRLDGTPVITDPRHPWQGEVTFCTCEWGEPLRDAVTLSEQPKRSK